MDVDNAKAILLKLSPIFLVYVVYIAIFSNEALQGDEARYLEYAQNLARGYYTESNNPYLRNGPGYPLYLLPFVILGLPLMLPALGHAFLLMGALVFFYRAARLFVSHRTATVASFALGLYPVQFIWLGRLSPEALTLFLCCGFLYFLLLATREGTQTWKPTILAGVFLAGLILTKIIFGMVVQIAVPLCALIYALSRNTKALRFLLALIIGFALTVPYLAYTFLLTERPLYWGTNGGEQLYWMTSPYKNEQGNWQSYDKIDNRVFPELDTGHYDFYDSIEDLSFVARNDAFSDAAIKNLKEHPMNYAKHWVANVSRLLFNMPYSFQSQNISPIFFIGSNVLWILPFLFSFCVAIVKRRKFPAELWLNLGFILIYLGGTSVVSATPRYIIPVMPYAILWIAIVVYRYVSVSEKLLDPEDLRAI